MMMLLKRLKLKVRQNIFFERQICITDGPLDFSGIIRSYQSPLGIMPIHQFRKKPNKYGKTSFVRIEPRT
ncbi:hypothetical protein Hanom_Chr05g00458881 [Helianthus anomalus]